MNVLSCPACQKDLRVPDDLLGKEVKCPMCMTIFTVPGLEGRPAPLDPVPRRDPLERSADLDDCPFCGEAVRVGSRVCSNCGEELVYALDEGEEDFDDGRPSVRHRLRRDCDPHRGSSVFVLGLFSLIGSLTGLVTAICWPLSIILLASSIGLGIAATIMGSGDLKRMAAGTMDRRGRERTKSGKVMGLVGFILSVVIIIAGVTLVIVLIYNAQQGRPFRFF